LRVADSRLFREVFFVMREGAEQPQEGDILAEANRILEENLLTQRKRPKKHPRLFALCVFLFGVVLGLAVGAAVL